MLSSAIVIHRARWRLAALTVQMRLMRLGLALSAYDPGQPRVPAGNPEGG